MAQYIHQIITGVTPLPASFWQISSRYIKPSVGDNFAAGISRSIFPTTDITVEGFYKHRSNTLDFVDNADIVLNKDVITQIRSGNSWSYGTEILLTHSTKKLNLSLSYTWSKAERKINEVNNGKVYYSPFDRRHSVSFLGTYNLSAKWSIGASWSYATGRPITLPSGSYKFQQFIVNLITERNGYRMPDYHRLDLSATYRPVSKRKWKSEWNFTIYNVYNRKNAFAVYGEPKFDANLEISNRFENNIVMLYLFTIVPGVSYTVTFK